MGPAARRLRADARIAGRAVAVASEGHISLVGSGPVASAAGGVGFRRRRAASGSRDDLAVSVREAEIDLDSTTDRSGVDGASSAANSRSSLADPDRARRVFSRSCSVSAKPTRGVVERLSTSFGCAPQTAAFADQQSVIDNIDLVRAIRSEPFDGDELGLLDALGLEGLADRPAGALSGGERQRLAWRALLAVDAELVALDEPTSQLDRATARLISRAIRDCADRGACVVCASHDEELIAVADQIVDLGAAPRRPGVTCQ